MNPNTATGTKSLTPDQQSRLSSVMGTQVSTPPKTEAEAKTTSQPNQAQTPISTSTLAQSSTQNPTTVMPPPTLSTPPQSTYEAPTISPTRPSENMTISVDHSKSTKPKTGGGSVSLKIVGFVVLGMVLLVVYTIVWAVIFNLTLPFGISLPV